MCAFHVCKQFTCNVVFVMFSKWRIRLAISFNLKLLIFQLQTAIMFAHLQPIRLYIMNNHASDCLLPSLKIIYIFFNINFCSNTNSRIKRSLHLRWQVIWFFKLQNFSNHHRGGQTSIHHIVIILVRVTFFKFRLH